MEIIVVDMKEKNIFKKQFTRDTISDTKNNDDTIQLLKNSIDEMHESMFKDNEDFKIKEINIQVFSYYL